MDAMDVSEWMNDEEDDESDYFIENIEITEPTSLKNSISGSSLCSDVTSTSRDNSSAVPSLALDSLESDSIGLVSLDDDYNNIIVEQRNSDSVLQSQQLGKRNQQHAVRPATDSSSRGDIYNRQIANWDLARSERRTWWLIPANHRLKILWNVYTVLLSFVSLYATHQAIRDRRYDHNVFHIFCNVWFFLDMLLNFFTEHRSSDGSVIRDGRAVWARYLTSWFIVDALSLVSWEHILVKPIIEMQNRRGFFKKLFFRSRSVIRVSRKLRGNHFRLFGRVAKKTKHVGVSSRGLLRLIIKYAPKYVLFFRNMRGVLAVRMLRQIHWIRKLFKNLYVTSSTSRPVRSLRKVSKLVNREKLVKFLSPPRRPENIRRARSASSTTSRDDLDVSSRLSFLRILKRYDSNSLELSEIREDEADGDSEHECHSLNDVHSLASGTITRSPTKLD